jgi:hypothetical protein
MSPAFPTGFGTASDGAAYRNASGTLTFTRSVRLSVPDASQLDARAERA